MERLKEAFSKGTMVDIFSQIVEITVGSGICTIARKSIRTFVETFFRYIGYVYCMKCFGISFAS